MTFLVRPLRYMNAMPDNHNPGLRTTERALDLLELVASSPERLKVRDAAHELGLNLSTTYHQVNTLVRRQYLDRDPAGYLRLGVSVEYLGQAYASLGDWWAGLQHIVEGLSIETGETAYLSTLERTGVVVRTIVEPQRAVRVAGAFPGFVGREHARASGQAVLAFMTHDRLDDYLRHRADADEQIDIDQLRRSLARVRRDGYAFDDQKFAEEVCCFGAPVFDAADAVVGAIAVSVPSHRAVSAHDRIALAVKASAESASRLISSPESSVREASRR